MPGTLNRRIDDQRLVYLQPFLEARFGVLSRTADFAHADYANAVHVIEAKFRGGRGSVYESYRLSRRKFQNLRRAALGLYQLGQPCPVPIIVWAFSDEVLYADLWAIAPDGYEIPWEVGGRFDRIGTPRAGAHDRELVWDVPRALCHVLVAAPEWDPVNRVELARAA